MLSNPPRAGRWDRIRPARKASAISRPIQSITSANGGCLVTDAELAIRGCSLLNPDLSVTPGAVHLDRAGPHPGNSRRPSGRQIPPGSNDPGWKRAPRASRAGRCAHPFCPAAAARVGGRRAAMIWARILVPFESALTPEDVYALPACSSQKISRRGSPPSPNRAVPTWMRPPRRRWRWASAPASAPRPWTRVIFFPGDEDECRRGSPRHGAALPGLSRGGEWPGPGLVWHSPADDLVPGPAAGGFRPGQGAENRRPYPPGRAPGRSILLPADL